MSNYTTDRQILIIGISLLQGGEDDIVIHTQLCLSVYHVTLITQL